MMIITGKLKNRLIFIYFAGFQCLSNKIQLIKK